METAASHLEEIEEFVLQQAPMSCNVGDLTIGLECGGSDPFSGVTANPAVGLVVDRLVDLGATVILSEIPEMIGAEGVLEKKFGSPQVRQKVLSRIDDYVQCAHRCGCDLRGSNPSPGNIKAGLSSIEEKSLGCIVKGGTSAIQEYVPYAQRASKKGLVVMDTPGNDPESVTGMVAGGAQAVLFTTGVGTPLGNPVAPVIKISSNSRTYERMRDFIDIDAGPIVEGRPVAEIADRMFEFLVEVCNGRETAAERNQCREFAINRIGPTF